MNLPQVWVCPTNIPLHYQSFLSSEEVDRSEKFKFPQDKQRYLAVRTALRILLARNINCSPESLKFTYNPKGKPLLVSNYLGISGRNFLGGELFFNVAHSGNCGLIALHWDGKIGVDLELMEAKTNCLKLAKRFFAPEENILLRSLQDNEQIQAFYQLWTAKEAFLKATGEGISGGLDQVILAPSLDKYQFLPTGYDLKHWQLSTQPLLANYWMAIAWQGKRESSSTLTIREFTWDADKNP